MSSNKDLQAQAKDKEVPVTVTYVNSSTSEHFKMPTTATLKQVFDEGYSKLTEKPRPTDQYFCKGGTSMTPYLTLTLDELHERKVCRDRHFEIHSETGGA